MVNMPHMAATLIYHLLEGFDDHKPKGHHSHRGTDEREYNFEGVDELVAQILE